MTRSPRPSGVQRSPGSAFAEFKDVHRPQALHCGQGNGVVSALSVNLLQTYQRCSPHFTYSSQLVPRRVLTKPSEPTSNAGHDNVNSDLVVCVHDVLVSTTGTRYVVKDLLGQGTFGQVFRCVEQDSGALVAVKVIKNQPAYYHQARVEVGVLQYLNTRADPGDKHHIVRMKDFFLFRSHLCLAFELLSLNLYELIRHNKFRGLSLPLVRVFTTQILDALVVLRDSRIVHCDLKPENVLLKTIETGEVKVIDFGSACFESRTVYSYIQSRFYRSPEVVVGYPYTMAIDMWSLGCMAAELYLGLPLFPGACEHDLLTRMVSMLGPLPDTLLVHGKNTSKYFNCAEECVDVLEGEPVVRRRYRVRTREEFEAATGQAAPVGKNYFQHTALADIIGAYPIRCGTSDEAVAREKQQRQAFVDFLLGVLDLDPASRWTPRQAMQHPFITGEPFTGPFQPPADPSSAHSSSSAAAKRWDAASPSPTPVGTPMSIPATRSSRSNAAAAAGGVAPMVGTPSWLSGLGAAGGSAAAALMATSPQVHAQAHAAAMAAVQAQMSLRQQAGQGAAAPNGYNYAGLAAEYNPGHSLQAIIPTLAAAVAAGYGGAASLGGTPMAQSLTTPLLSPPSRSFGPHLRYPDYYGSSGLEGGQGQGMSTASSSLQTPTRGGAMAAFSPMQLGSFTPSSVTTYQAALAAAHAAMLHQQQQPVAAAVGGGMQQQAGALDGVALLSQSARMAQAAAQQALMQGGMQYNQVAAAGGTRGGWAGLPGSSYTTAQQAAGRTALGGAAGAAHPPLPGYGAGAGARQDPIAAAALLAGMSAMEASRAGSRWVSMEGSMEGTPPRLGTDGLSAAAAADESGPNPADWDPLWSDDLLEEDGSAGGGGGPHSSGHSPGMGALRATGRAQPPAQQQQQQQVGGAAPSTGQLPYGGDWFQEQNQRQQQAVAAGGGLSRGVEAQQAVCAAAGAAAELGDGTGSTPAVSELPGSYCVPLPTAFLLGLGGQQQQQQQQQQQLAAQQPAEPQGAKVERGSGVAPDLPLPLPSSALLGGSRRQAEDQEAEEERQLQLKRRSVEERRRGVQQAAGPPLPSSHQASPQPQTAQQSPAPAGSPTVVGEELQLGHGLGHGLAAAPAAAAAATAAPAGQTPQLWRQQQQQQWLGDRGGGGGTAAQPPASSSFEFHQSRGGAVSVGGAGSSSRAVLGYPPMPPHHVHAAAHTAAVASNQAEQQLPQLPALAAAAHQQQWQLQQLQQHVDGGPQLLQQQQQHMGQPAAYGASLFALPPGWGGAQPFALPPEAAHRAPGMDVATQLSTQLSARLTQDLALSGLVNDDGMAAAAAAVYQRPDLLHQQQQQQQQQQQYRQNNQPMQRMQGFDILK